MNFVKLSFPFFDFSKDFLVKLNVFPPRVIFVKLEKIPTHIPGGYYKIFPSYRFVFRFFMLHSIYHVF